MSAHDDIRKPPRFVEAGGARIAYEERGTGYPLLLLHGYYPDRRLWIGPMERLFDAQDRACLPATPGAGRPVGGPSARSYRRIYPDLPFMGQSSDPDSVRSSDDFLRVAVELVRALIPEGPFLLAGESYGGYLARGLLREFPDRVKGLFLLCPLIVAPRGERSLPERRVYREEPGYAAGADPEEIAEFESVAALRTAYTLERARREVTPGVALARTTPLEAVRDRAFTFSFDRLGALRPEGGETPGTEPFDPVFPGPALFLLGRRDDSTGYRDALRLLDRYPGASYAILDGMGHNLQLEAPGVFETMTGEWLARCEAE